MSPVRRPTRSGETQAALLDAAERLFAERGLHGVSLREIGAAAGQRNQAATQYHFGDRDGLVLAVFERRAVEVNARRSALLEAALADGPATARDLVHAFVAPMAEQVALGNDYIRFLSRLETDGAGDVLRSSRVEARSAYERIGRMLRSQHVAALPRDLFWNRWKLVIDTALAALASQQTALARDPAGTLPLEVFTSELIDALTAMLLAPSSLRAAR